MTAKLVLLVPLCYIIFVFQACISSSNKNPSPFAENISINCGLSGTSVSENGKKWLGDITRNDDYSFLRSVKGSSSTSSQKLNNVVDPTPYKTARVSRSKFVYEFQVSPGEKIVRLHFSPGSYRGFQKSIDLIDVEAGQFTLLSNFSASLTAEALGVKYFVKEFCMIVDESQLLRLIFSPANDNAFAFINGIEIISVPVALSYFHARDDGVQAVGGKCSTAHVDRNSALENIYRWNPKSHQLHFASRHSGDLFSTWATKKDNSKTKNDTFRVLADVGFNYLIRLHFSELALKMAARDDLMFKVFIGKTFVQSNTDLLKETEDSGMKWYRDYLVTTMRGHKNHGKSHLLISVESHGHFIDGSGILAGFEILKLTNADHSLASPNPVPSQPRRHSVMKTAKYILSFLDYKDVIFAIVTAITAVASIVVCELREFSEANRVEEKNKLSERAQRVCRRFSLDEIRHATKCYSDDLLIGKGGFGRVYKGIIDGGQETVAVKKLKLDSRQGAHEFLTEIETLSELRHINLVPLIGYCNEYREMMLVYKYMAGGTLADHLYNNARKGKYCSVLTWKQRLNICIGAARGLDYLHTGHGIIHRDVKSSNILLDENFEAKVSDFGLAKPEDRSKSQSHVSTNVKGTPGYWDPHYYNTRKLTRKSDTYAFGVVLFEALCGRPAVDLRLVEDEQFLVTWVQKKIINKDDIDQIVDPILSKETISPDSLKTFVEVAERCINDVPTKRPTMSQVVLQLEVALEQQENKRSTLSNEIPYNPSDDNHLHSNGGTDLSTIVEQVNLMPSDENSLTSPHDDQNKTKVAGFELPAGEEYEAKDRRNKPSRLWPWGVQPSKKNELQILLEILESEIKMNKIDLDTIAAATNQFSSKIAIGIYSSVYKGVLPTGQEVAVKSLSLSKQGFRYEIRLLPNLQHQNIVKIVGYCISLHRQEFLLVYDFMQNGSLANFIGGSQPKQLQWPMRLNIIMGIARGLGYLHHDSGLRVIHRDLKPGHILLDGEMNPNISGFASASTMVEELSEVVINYRKSSFGYMAPERIYHGKVSSKSDVYSFGIMVLEIVSGRTVRYHEIRAGSTNHAWKLWKRGRALDLVDESLGGSFPAEKALRCIQVGLLCIQEQPEDRPEMTSVLEMLQGDEPLAEPDAPDPFTLYVSDDDTYEPTLEYNDNAER